MGNPLSPSSVLELQRSFVTTKLNSEKLKEKTESKKKTKNDELMEREKEMARKVQMMDGDTPRVTHGQGWAALGRDQLLPVRLWLFRVFELKELWPLRMVCRGWDEAVRLFFELPTEEKCFEEGNVVDDNGGDYPNHFICRFKPKGQRAATSKELLAECIRVVEKRIPKSEQDPAFSRDRYGLIHLQLPQFRDFKKQLKEKRKKSSNSTLKMNAR